MHPLTRTIRLATSDLRCPSIWWSPLIGTRWVSRDRLLHLRYRGARFRARMRDWLGVQEVLLDGEYAFVLDIIARQRLRAVLDLGANIGAFAIFVLRHTPDVTVTSVEASPATHGVLAANCKAFGDTRWQTMQGAVWYEEGELPFAEMEFSTGSRLARYGGSSGAPDGVSLVRALDLGRLLEHIGERALVKMDIEGAELEVLSRRPELLERIGVLVIEVHSDRGDADPVMRVLRNAYPALYRVRGRKSSKPLIVAARAAVEHRLLSAWQP